MSYVTKAPDPDTLIATSDKFNAKLYAYLAAVPLYATCRLLAPGHVGKRSSFWLGWIIKEQRLAAAGDRYKLPESIIEWIEEKMHEAYGSHAEATGMSETEVLEMEKEQAIKRKRYQ